MEPVPSSRRVLVWRARLSKEIVRQGIGAPTRNGAAGGGLGVDVLSPVIVGKAPGLCQLNRNINWLCQSTQVPGSPQRASWPFRLNAVILIVGLIPTDSNASTMIWLTLSACSG